MPLSYQKIKSFTNLIVWQQGHKLVVEIYLISKLFPKDEAFGLTSQIRRCSVSITSNIAEGFSRSSAKEKIHFYSIALGSVTELQNQLLIARDIGYVSAEKFTLLAEKTVAINKMINGLIKKSKCLILAS